MISEIRLFLHTALTFLFVLGIQGLDQSFSQTMDQPSPELQSHGPGLQYTDSIDTGLEILYSGDYRGSLQFFSQLEGDEHTLSRPFFSALAHRWMALADSAAYGDSSRESALRAIEIFETWIDEHPHDPRGHFYLGAAYSFLIEYHFQRSNWIRVLLASRRLNRHLHLCLELDPEFVDAHLPLGVYDYFTDASLPYHTLLRGLVFTFTPEGDRHRGVERIQRVIREGVHGKVEAKTALLYVRYMDGPIDEGLRIARHLHFQFPDNPTFHEFLGLLHFKSGDFSRAARTFHEILRNTSQRKGFYVASLGRRARYRLGLCYSRGGVTGEALKQFSTLLGEIQPEERGLARSCHEAMGDAYLKRRQSRAARASYNKALGLDPSNEVRTRLKQKLKITEDIPSPGRNP